MIAAALAVLLAAAGSATPAPTPAAPPPGAPAAPDVFRIPAGRVRVQAERVTVSRGHVVEATGGVQVEAPGMKARAERIEWDGATNMIEVSGGVTLDLDADGEKAHMTAASASIDLKTRAGVLRDAVLTGAGMTLKGARIVRTESGRYRIDGARFTPCQCADGIPSWEITASRVSVKPEGLGILQGGVFRAKGIPVLFLPIGFAPASTERASGFLSPQAAQTSNDGVIVSLPLYLAIARAWDLSLDPGYNQERGPFVGGTLRLANDRGTGQLEAVYHSDRRVKGDAATFPGRPDLYSPDRWYTNDRVTEQLPGPNVVKVRAEVASDDRYGFDFGPTLMERSRPDYESNAALEHRGDVVGVVASGNYYQDLRVIGSAGPYNSAQTVSRLGGIDLSAGGLPLIGGSGLGIDANLDGRYDFFDNIGSPQAGFHKGGQLESVPRRGAQHARVEPMLAAPLSLLDDAIRVRAFAGAIGDVTSDPLGTDARQRVAPELGGDARMEGWRTFGNTTKVQHRIGPFARVTWIPDVYGDALTSFESPVDAPLAGNDVAVGLSNRILYRRAGAGSQQVSPVREILELLLYERFVPKGPQKGESVASVNVRTGPLRMDLEAALDNKVGQIRTAGGRAATSGDAPAGLSIDYAYAPERRSHQGTSGAWLKLREIFTRDSFPSSVLKTLTLESGVRYDVVSHTFPSVSGGVNYESPCGCWGVRAGAARDSDRRGPTFHLFLELHPPSTIKRYQPAPGGR